ncbi:unnamed protein product, partial [Iphiclides podalirius]
MTMYYEHTSRDEAARPQYASTAITPDIACSWKCRLHGTRTVRCGKIIVTTILGFNDDQLLNVGSIAREGARWRGLRRRGGRRTQGAMPCRSSAMTQRGASLHRPPVHDYFGARDIQRAIHSRPSTARLYCRTLYCLAAASAVPHQLRVALFTRSRRECRLI